MRYGAPRPYLGPPSNQEAPVAYEGLTLRSPRDGRTLIRTSVSVPHGMRDLIRGRDASAQVALFRATGRHDARPDASCTRARRNPVPPQRPYLPPGTLRELLLLPQQEHAVPDDRIFATLTALDLDRVLARAGGSMWSRSWDDILSLRRAAACSPPPTWCFTAAPRFAFLDRPAMALSPAQEEQVLQLLSARSISYVTTTETDEPTNRYDAVLDLTGGGAWTWSQMPP